MSLHREAGVSEAACGRTVVPDPVAAACSDTWVRSSLGCCAGWPGWLGQAAVLSGNRYLCHCCTDFQVFSACCPGVSVNASPAGQVKMKVPGGRVAWGLDSSNSNLLVKPLFPGRVDGTPGMV